MKDFVMPQMLEDLAQALEAGQTTSRALIEQYFDRIEDPAGQGGEVFVSTNKAGALAAADAIDKLRGAAMHPHPFAGIPLAVKDLFDVRGQVTTAGSRVMAERPPAQADAPAIASLRAAGFIPIGRTNMTEFAFSGLGLNPHFGTPLSPFERDIGAGRLAGGSSSGSAAAVADGMAPAAIGSDTSGSCRIPAAFCGVTGYRPSAHRISLEGVTPLSPSLDTIGPIAQSVRCCQILDGIMAGTGPGIRKYRDINLLRFIVPETVLLENLDEKVARDFDFALRRLSYLGATVDVVALEPLSDLAAMNAKGSIAIAEALHWHRSLIDAHFDLYDPRVRDRILLGEGMSATLYLDLIEERARIIRAITPRLAGYDAMLSPTVSIPPPTLAEFDTTDEHYFAQNGVVLRNTLMVSMLGGCALSVPMHGPGTAPTGLMISGLSGQDGSIFAVGEAIEKVDLAGTAH